MEQVELMDLMGEKTFVGMNNFFIININMFQRFWAGTVMPFLTSVSNKCLFSGLVQASSFSNPLKSKLLGCDLQN